MTREASSEGGQPEQRFTALVAEFAGTPAVSGPHLSGRGSGSSALKVDGSICAIAAALISPSPLSSWHRQAVVLPSLHTIAVAQNVQPTTAVAEFSSGFGG